MEESIDELKTDRELISGLASMLSFLLNYFTLN